MEFVIERDEGGMVTRFHGSVPDYVIQGIGPHLDALDRAVLGQECSTPADHLLNLELLFRRWAEIKAGEERKAA